MPFCFTDNVIMKFKDLFRSPDEGFGRNVARALNYRFINFLFPLELYGQDLIFYCKKCS